MHIKVVVWLLLRGVDSAVSALWMPWPLRSSWHPRPARAILEAHRPIFPIVMVAPPLRRSRDPAGGGWRD